MAHTLVSAQRVLEALEVVETDPRVQVVFTVGPDVFAPGTRAWLESRGVMVVAWEQAAREHCAVAVTAGYGGIAELTAPVVVLPHGAGYGKFTPQAPDEQPVACRAVYGLDAARLVRHGRVVAATIVLSHEDQRAVLARQCPAALPAARVVGDPCLDQLTASLPHRSSYRHALGVGRRRAVVVASTWGPHGLFGRDPDLFTRLVTDLDPDQYAVAALLHPAVWTGHGRRQVSAWLRAAQARGLRLIDPRTDWRPILLAADCVLGDHGSVATYAAALGCPVLHTDLPLAEVHDHTPQALLGRITPRLTRSRPLGEQIDAVIGIDTTGLAAAVTAALTSYPGQAHHRLRQILYHHLQLAPPTQPHHLAPLSTTCGAGAA